MLGPLTWYWSRDYPEVGGLLLFYTLSLTDLGHRAALCVDKMNGPTPATLPIKEPSQYALVIN